MINIYTVNLMIFVDLSAWFAFEVEDDINHESAQNFLVEIAPENTGSL